MSKQVRLLEFEDFSLDTEQRVLKRKGERVHLALRPMAMLLVLVENRHRIVSRDELMERVWEGVIVEDANIATNIARLRRALTNGNGDGRELVKTISGYGYQFVADVRERIIDESTALVPPAPEPVVLPAPAPEPQPAPIKPPAPLPVSPLPTPIPSLRRYLRYFGITTGLAIIAFIAWATMSSKTKPPTTPEFDHQLVISWKNRFGDDEMSLVRPSPDGRMVAYSKSENEQTDIFIQEVDRQNPTRVTSDPWPDFGPVWSPDGKQIAYQSKRADTIEVAVIDLLTHERKVISTLPIIAGGYRLLRWSQKSPRIIYTDDQNLFALRLNGTETVRLTNFQEEQSGPTEFGLSPDEEKIAYIRRENGRSFLFAAHLDGSQPVQLTHGEESVDYPEWFGDNEQIAYGSSYGGAWQISVIAARGGTPTPLTLGRETTELQHLSPDGQKIFYTIRQFEGGLFRCDLKDGSETEFEAGQGLKLWPEVAPDGKTLLFHRADDDNKHLHSQILTTPLEAPSHLPTEVAADGFDARWAPTGERLGFLRLTEKGYQLWLLDQGNAAPRLLTEEIRLQQGYFPKTLGWTQPGNYSWSPSGTRVAYSARTGGSVNIWALSTDGQTKTQRSQNSDPKLNLVSPLWSPDETRVAYLAQSSFAKKLERRVIVNDGAGDQTIFLTDLPVRMIGWLDSEHFLTAVLERGGPMLSEMTLKRISLAGGETQETIGQELPIYANSLRLSPDRKTLAFTARRNDCDNIWLYTLATRQLRQVTANQASHLHLTGLSWLPDGSALCLSKHSITTSIWMMKRRN